MSIKLVIQGVDDVSGIQNFTDPIEAEAAYFRLCQHRTDGPGAVKISSKNPLVPDAYFRLDQDWDGNREQYPERMGLWTDTAEGYQIPTPEQLRGVSRALNLSGEVIARRLGTTGRLWRYWLCDHDANRTIPWTSWRCLIGWLNERNT
jgi:hypothetical protein